MMYNIIDYGAVAGGKQLCTAAIQKAIDDCAANGGGVVTVPAGTYLTGSVFLKSHVELHLEHGSVLQASDNMADYNAPDAYPENWGSAAEEWTATHLIIAYRCEDVALTGDGVIDGAGDRFFGDPFFASWYGWADGIAKSKDKEILRPGQSVVFILCKHIHVEGFTLRNTTCWGVFLHGCDFADIRNIQVINPCTSANTDGIDIDCCSYVTVSGCRIDTGDDCIAIRGSGKRLPWPDKPCEYITVSDCVLFSGSSVFRIGVGAGDIRHVRISNIVITHGARGLNLMCDWNSEISTGLTDVNISNVSATGVARAFTIRGGKHKGARQITIENYRAECTAASYVRSSDQSLTEDITLRNIDLHMVNLFDGIRPDMKDQRGNAVRDVRGDEMVYFRNVRGLRVDGLRIFAADDVRAVWNRAVDIDDCPGLRIDGLEPELR